MDDPYLTYTSKYIESVWWLIKKINEKGLLYKGYTIQPYSPMAGTGLSSHELNQPGTYQDVTDTTVTAQFKTISKSLPQKLKGNIPLYILAWTTTPWTLPSNTALTVGKKIDYIVVRTFNQYTFKPVRLLFAKNLLKNLFGNIVTLLSTNSLQTCLVRTSGKISHILTIYPDRQIVGEFETAHGLGCFTKKSQGFQLVRYAFSDENVYP